MQTRQADDLVTSRGFGGQSPLPVGPADLLLHHPGLPVLVIQPLNRHLDPLAADALSVDAVPLVLCHLFSIR